MVWERKIRPAPLAASASGSPRSIAPAASASAIAPLEDTPVMEPVKPAFRSANPNEAPIRPVPTMTTLFIQPPVTALAPIYTQARQPACPRQAR